MHLGYLVVGGNHEAIPFVRKKKKKRPKLRVIDVLKNYDVKYLIKHWVE